MVPIESILKALGLLRDIYAFLVPSRELKVSFFTTGLLFGLFMCTFSKVIWVLWGSTKLSFKRERVTFSNLTLRRRNWADNQPASDRSSSRGAKPQNFPDSNFLRAKTFQTKCAKRFSITSLKSALLPLTTLPKNV